MSNRIESIDRGRRGGYTYCMFLNGEGPIAGERELGAFRRARPADVAN